MQDDSKNSTDADVHASKIQRHQEWLAAHAHELATGDPERVALARTDSKHANMDGEVIRIDLSGAQLQFASLRGADLSGVCAKEASFDNADLGHIKACTARLPGAMFRGADLRKADLSGANLRAAKLGGADLTGADLRDADFRDADLSEATLTDAKIRGAILYDCDLGGADLRVHDLCAGQLAGADVSGTRLPDTVRAFEGITEASAMSENARSVFFILLVGCFISLLFIWNTNQAAMVIGNRESPIPFINTSVSLEVFFFAAPLVIASVYFYLLLYVQRLWEVTVNLPSVFPDGRSIVHKAYPWLPMGIIREWMPRLQLRDRLALQFLQSTLAVALVYGLAPLTLALYWWKIIPIRNEVLTIWHVFLVVVSTNFGLYQFFLARTTLRGTLRFRSVPPARAHWQAFGLAASLVVFVLATLAQWHYASIELAHEELSTRPADWQLPGDAAPWDHGFRRALNLTKGARLGGVNLRGARASGVFLAGADLEAADFRDADLRYAILAGADLRGADLREADLSRADLRDADLSCANLDGALLDRADLRGALLTRARLRNADLDHANLKQAAVQYANLEQARLVDTHLLGADLLGANLTRVEAWHTEFTNAELRGARLKEARLLLTEPAPAEIKLAALASVKDPDGVGNDGVAAAVDGAELFGLCAPCHSLRPEIHKIGPSLAGVFERRAASAPGFVFSEALVARGELGLTWGADALDSYLRDPADFIPSNNMRFMGLEDEVERRGLIEFLRKVKAAEGTDAASPEGTSAPANEAVLNPFPPRCNVSPEAG